MSGAERGVNRQAAARTREPTRALLWNKVTQAQPACGERVRGVEPLPDVALECIRGWIEQL